MRYSAAVLGAVGLAVLGFFWGLHYHGFAHAIGIDTQLSEEYAFFSGFGTWLLAALGYTGIVAGLWHHLNCHRKGCWRIARYPVAGGEFKVCQRHHPDAAVKDGLTGDDLLHWHNGYLKRRGK